MVNVGSSTDDASYKLEKKTGNGAYETVKTWDNGDLADAEFGEDYTDNVISTGTVYTYRVTATVQVKDANKNLRSWSNSAEAPSRSSISSARIFFASAPISFSVSGASIGTI